jgi:hypothetical protein
MRRGRGPLGTVRALAHAPLAQLVEHPALNRQVRGSSPWRRTHENRPVGAGSRRFRIIEAFRSRAPRPRAVAYRLPTDTGPVPTVRRGAVGRRPGGSGTRPGRRGSGSIRVRNGRLLAQVSLGTDPTVGASDAARPSTAGRRPRPGSPRSSSSTPADQPGHRRAARRLPALVARRRGAQGQARPPAARRTTLAHYRVNVERHLIPELGTARSASSPSASSTRSRAASSPPATPPRRSTGCARRCARRCPPPSGRTG